VRPHPTDSDAFGRSDSATEAHDGLADAMVRRIENATCGRVSGQYVARLGESIVLHGYCRTYHARELAHQAALDIADGNVTLIDLLTVS